jgi:hypothetical protein
MDLPLPLALRALSDEVDDRLARIPTPLNEYGFDPFGASLTFARRAGTVAAFLYRHYFRVESHGIEKVPEGRVLLIANHAGNTLPMDGTMLSAALLLDAEPPRFARAWPSSTCRDPVVERDDPPGGAVVGTPENCVRLLEREEAIMVFPRARAGSSSRSASATSCSASAPASRGWRCRPIRRSSRSGSSAPRSRARASSTPSASRARSARPRFR